MIDNSSHCLKLCCILNAAIYNCNTSVRLIITTDMWVIGDSKSCTQLVSNNSTHGRTDGICNSNKMDCMERKKFKNNIYQSVKTHSLNYCKVTRCLIGTQVFILWALSLHKSVQRNFLMGPLCRKLESLQMVVASLSTSETYLSRPSMVISTASSISK